MHCLISLPIWWALCTLRINQYLTMMWAYLLITDIMLKVCLLLQKCIFHLKKKTNSLRQCMLSHKKISHPSLKIILKIYLLCEMFDSPLVQFLFYMDWQEGGQLLKTGNHWDWKKNALCYYKEWKIEYSWSVWYCSGARSKWTVLYSTIR